MKLIKRRQKYNENVYAIAQRKYAILRRRYRLSAFGFVFLKVMAFAISAITIILSLWAFRFNDVTDSKPFFVAIAILGGIASFIMSVISLFTFRKAANRTKNRIEAVERERELFENAKGEYADEATRQARFTRKLTEISGE